MDAAGFRAAGAPVLRHGSASSRSTRRPPSRSTPRSSSRSRGRSPRSSRAPWLGRRDRRRRRRDRLRRRPHRRHRRRRRRRHRVRAGQPVRRHGRRAAAGRRHPGAHPLDRDEPGRRARAPASCGSTCGRRVDDKAAALREWAGEHGIPLSRIAYLGNDVNDLSCLELVGWPVAVPDAHPLVLAAARRHPPRSGGAGAVRDLADRVLRAQRAGTRARFGGAASRTEPKGQHP